MSVRTLGTNRAKPPLGVPLNRNHKLAKGLVGCWLFNEGGGTTLYDLSGYGTAGALTNIASPPTASSGWNLGVDGPVLTFDGDDDRVNLGNPSALKLDEFSVEALVYLDSTVSETYPKVIDWEDDSYGFQLLYLKPISEGWSFSVGDGVAANSIDSLLTWTNQYVHLLGTYDGSNGHFFVNAVERGTPFSDVAVSYAGVSELNIGNRGADARHFKGPMRFVRIYNRALTAQEVMELYVDLYCMFEWPMVWGWVEVAAGIVIFRRRIEGY